MSENTNNTNTENAAPPAPVSPLSMIFGRLGKNLILRGILELVIGILLLVTPIKTVTWLTIVIGALLIIDGVALFIAYLRSGDTGSVWMLINSIALVIFGAVIVGSPLMMDWLWIIVLGVWHIVSAINELCSGGWRRPMGLLSGVLSLLIGVIFIVLPFVALKAVILVTGIMMVAYGCFSLITGADLRAASKQL